jgi:2-polyprenyl-3-methyl-5-hydroxy-6-metoxy-1,4-benzoquinol methylase
MTPEQNYLEINRNSWNRKTEIHLHSAFYDMEGFLKGNTSLNSIELNLLGDVKGKRILHLQCHFGQDSISLSRMGAEVTGIDLSDAAIAQAREIAAKTGTNTRFICSDVYQLPEVLHEKFDLVFTSYGTIGWLPDMDKWARVITHFLKPEGSFVFAEFHPVVWMFDSAFKEVAYNYFNSEPIVETESGTYAEKESDITLDYVSWNHSLGEVLSALLANGLTLEQFQEFDYSPYDCFKGTVEIAPRKYRIQHLENKIPMVYALKAKWVGI